jgi:Peroxiredoxin
MMNTTSRATLIALLTIGAGCKAAPKDAGSAAFHPLDVGAPVPAYTALTLTGDTVHVGGSGAPMVVNVWATWCTSCREEMTALDSLNHEFGARGLRVIGVSVDEGDVAKVKRYAESNHLGFTVAHDPAGDIQRSYQVMGVPTTFVIGKDGTLRWRHTGNISDIMGEVRGAVEKAVLGN